MRWLCQRIFVFLIIYVKISIRFDLSNNKEYWLGSSHLSKECVTAHFIARRNNPESALKKADFF
jgi:hypothetical protein